MQYSQIQKKIISIDTNLYDYLCSIQETPEKAIMYLIFLLDQIYETSQHIRGTIYYERLVWPTE